LGDGTQDAGVPGGKQDGVAAPGATGPEHAEPLLVDVGMLFEIGDGVLQIVELHAR